MPALTTPKWECFARYLALGWAQERAYKAAGYENANSTGNATQLSKRVEIQARIHELIDEKIARETGYSPNADGELGEARDRIEAGDGIDAQWVISQLIENVKLARETGQIAAANKALEMLGREVGLFQEKNAKEAAKAKEIKEVAKKKGSDAIPLSRVNKLLDAIGFTGKIDATTMLPVKEDPPEDKQGAVPPP